MDDAVRNALAVDQLIDITTVGRTTGQPRRIEIWFHSLDGALYITGTPGARSWYANLLASPDFTFHLKQSLQRDIPARATPITDPATRRDVFTKMQEAESRMAHVDVDVWVEQSPLVQVAFTDSICLYR